MSNVYKPNLQKDKCHKIPLSSDTSPSNEVEYAFERKNQWRNRSASVWSNMSNISNISNVSNFSKASNCSITSNSSHNTQSSKISNISNATYCSNDKTQHSEIATRSDFKNKQTDETQVINTSKTNQTINAIVEESNIDENSKSLRVQTSAVNDNSTSNSYKDECDVINNCSHSGKATTSIEMSMNTNSKKESQNSERRLNHQSPESLVSVKQINVSTDTSPKFKVSKGVSTSKEKANFNVLIPNTFPTSPKPVVSSSKFVKQKVKKEFISQDYEIPSTVIPNLKNDSVVSPQKIMDRNTEGDNQRQSALEKNALVSSEIDEMKKIPSLKSYDSNNFQIGKVKDGRDCKSCTSDSNSKELPYIRKRAQSMGITRSRVTRSSSFGSGMSRPQIVWEEIQPVVHDARSKANPKVSALRQKFEPKIMVQHIINSEDDKGSQSCESYQDQFEEYDFSDIEDNDNPSLSANIENKNTTLQQFYPRTAEKGEMTTPRFSEMQQINFSESITKVHQSTSVPHSLQSTATTNTLVSTPQHDNFDGTEPSIPNPRMESVIKSYLKKRKMTSMEQKKKVDKDLLSRYRNLLEESQNFLNHSLDESSEDRKSKVNIMKMYPNTTSSYINIEEELTPRIAPTPHIAPEFQSTNDIPEQNFNSPKLEVINSTPNLHSSKKNNISTDTQQSEEGKGFDTPILREETKYNGWEALVQSVEAEFQYPSKIYSISPKKLPKVSDVRKRAKTFLERFSKKSPTLPTSKMQGEIVHHHSLKDFKTIRSPQKKSTKRKLKNAQCKLPLSMYEKLSHQVTLSQNVNYVNGEKKISDRPEDNQSDNLSENLSLESIDEHDGNLDESNLITSLQSRLDRIRNRTQFLRNTIEID